MLIARETGAEIISVDSMQVYRGMDIGTAKPSAQDRAAVPHHLIDIVDPEQRFTVAQFQGAGRVVLDDLDARATPALVVGGSGLHFRSLVDPLTFAGHDEAIRADVETMGAEAALAALLDADAEAGEHVDLANPRRVARALEVVLLTGSTPSDRASTPEARAMRSYEARIPFAAAGIDPGEALVARIERRLDRMLEAGWFAEVQALQHRLGPTASQAVGYRHLVRAARREWPLADAVRRARDATTSLARRQRTFHRRDPRITWVEWHDDVATLSARVTRALEEAGWTS
jgi:tRNA dimethylallyltransferase